MNLIVTCARHMEDEAGDEISGMLSALGDGSARVSRTGMSGIVTVETSVPPPALVLHVRGMVEEEPWSLRYVLRIIPVDRKVETSLEGIVEACSEYRSKIGGGSYRVTVEKRHSGVSSMDLISGIAGRIGGRVSLEELDFEILVEILGPETGIALVRRGDVISVPKLKRSE